MTIKGIEQLWVERNEALRILDLNWARQQVPFCVSDKLLLVALHKARYNCRAIEPHLRHESWVWLDKCETKYIDEAELVMPRAFL